MLKFPKEIWFLEANGHKFPRKPSFPKQYPHIPLKTMFSHGKWAQVQKRNMFLGTNGPKFS
jgi:hypothetical protein